MKKFIFVTGLPGSGKTFHAKKLAEGKKGLAVSADEFFEHVNEEGVKKYEFDSTKLGQAHAWCLSVAMEALEDGYDPVVVHNTGSQEWEYSNYLTLARIMGYEALVHEMDVRTTEQARACFKRNTHGVSAEVFGKMLLRWQSHRSAKKIPIFLPEAT